MKSVKNNIMVVLMVVLGLVCSNSAQAEVLMYDGFNYSGTLLDGNGDANWGDASKKWATSDALAVLTDGFTFGNLVTEGRAVNMIAAVTKGDPSASRQVAVAPAEGSDLFVSFLYRLNTGYTDNDGSGIRSADWDFWTCGGRQDQYYENGEITYSGSLKQGNNDINNTGSTYLVVAKFGNIGGFAVQEANFWAVSESSFDAIQITPGFTEFTEELLTSYSTSRNTSGPATSVGAAFTTNDYVEMFVLDSSGTGFNVILDELRFGTTLSSVLPIPEPATLGLLLIGSLALLRRRRTGEILQENGAFLKGNHHIPRQQKNLQK